MLSCRVPFHRVDVFCGTSNVNHPDVINIHINFMNGSTASSTLEFTGQQPTHLMKIFNGKGLSTFDLTEYRNHSYPRNNSLLTEQIEALIKNIRESTNPPFSLTEEIEVHRLMGKVKEKIDLHFCDILR